MYREVGGRRMSDKRFFLTRLDAEGCQSRVDALAELLVACVDAGAAIHFRAPLGPAAAVAFWRDGVAPKLSPTRRALWIAETEDRVLGTVLLDLDMPPNQPHRAEVSKLMTHPAARRRGVAHALMLALEAEAAARGRWLITLDTRADDSGAPFYASLGYAVAGVIPDFAYGAEGSDARHGAAYMFKRLPGAPTA